MLRFLAGLGLLGMSSTLGVGASWLQNQATGDAGSPLDAIIPALAGSSPFAALAMYIIVSQRADLKEADDRVDALVKDMMERVIPGQVESNRLHVETGRVLEQATVNAHQLAGRSFDPVTQARIYHLLQKLDSVP